MERKRCRYMNTDVYACFIDFHKAFNCVRHEKLVEILIQLNIDRKDVRIISWLYWNQTADIRMENTTSLEAKIKRGVCRGCVLSPPLFNIYAETIYEEALDENDGGIRVNGTIVNNIRYKDDSLLIANSHSEFRKCWITLWKKAKNLGL